MFKVQTKACCISAHTKMTCENILATNSNAKQNSKQSLTLFKSFVLDYYSYIIFN